MTTVKVIDRNETKYLFTFNLIGTSSPRNDYQLDYEFEATEELFNARRAYSLNALVPVLSFIAASKHIDNEIYQHRLKCKGGD